MKTLLLVGGGHAHLHILKHLQKRTFSNVRTVLISPSEHHYYSGMFSGFIEGLYTMNEIRISLVSLTHRAGVQFRKDRVVSVDPVNQTVKTERGDELSYDAVSFDVGSSPAGLDIPGAVEYATTIKPYETLAELPKKIDRAEQIVVVGGGASGVELSLAIQSRLQQSEKPSVRLISAGELLENGGIRISRKITEMIRRKGIQVFANDPVSSISSSSVHLISGRNVPFDLLLWLVGPQAPIIFSKGDHIADKNGYLQVNAKLQSPVYPNIFGAGDCITITEHPELDKAGVYAVREAPVLWDNLQRFFEGGRLQPYRPQPSYLSILSTGHEEGFLLYKGLSFHGAWCWRLKRRIDQAFIRKYQ